MTLLQNGSVQHFFETASAHHDPHTRMDATYVLATLFVSGNDEFVRGMIANRYNLPVCDAVNQAVLENRGILNDEGLPLEHRQLFVQANSRIHQLI